MGLDMYLYSKGDSGEFTHEVGYWRKANMIHHWFEKNIEGVENCSEAKVTREDLHKLKNIITTIFENLHTMNEQVVFDDKSEKLAKELLPTQGGFFFGSTDYDSMYIDDLTDTLAIIDKALSMPDNTEFVYWNWW